MGMNTRPLLVAIPLLLAGCGASPTEAYAPAAYATQPQQLTADPGEDLVGPLTPTAKALGRFENDQASFIFNQQLGLAKGMGKHNDGHFSLNLPFLLGLPGSGSVFHWDVTPSPWWDHAEGHEDLAPGKLLDPCYVETHLESRASHTVLNIEALVDPQPGGVVARSSAFSLGGQPALRLEWATAADKQGHTERFVRCVSARNGRAYHLTFSYVAAAEQTGALDAQLAQILTTWRWK